VHGVDRACHLSKHRHLVAEVEHHLLVRHGDVESHERKHTYRTNDTDQIGLVGDGKRDIDAVELNSPVGGVVHDR
jgi:hypothetical protein